MTPRNNFVLAHLDNTSVVNFVALAKVDVLLVLKVLLAQLVSVASI